MRTNNQISPIKGIKPIKNHQPLFPISWSRLTKTPNEGRRIAREYREEMQLNTGAILVFELASLEVAIPTRIPIRMAMIMFTKTNIQYSFLRALPLNTAYFLMTSIYQLILNLLSLNKMIDRVR
jgi:hypothetical protein